MFNTLNVSLDCHCKRIPKRLEPKRNHQWTEQMMWIEEGTDLDLLEVRPIASGARRTVCGHCQRKAKVTRQFQRGPWYLLQPVN